MNSSPQNLFRAGQVTEVMELLVTKRSVELNNHSLFLRAEGTTFYVRSKIVGPAKTTALSTAKETLKNYHTSKRPSQ